MKKILIIHLLRLNIKDLIEGNFYLYFNWYNTDLFNSFFSIKLYINTLYFNVYSLLTYYYDKINI
jgi:hypothetical protein